MVRSGWAMVRLKLKVLVTTPASVPIPTPFLCAVSFGYEHAIRSFPKHKTANSCPGANGGNCFPDHVWSDTRRDEGYYTAVRSMEGIFGTKNVCDGTGKCPYTYAFGARCVLDLNV